MSSNVAGIFLAAVVGIASGIYIWQPYLQTMKKTIEEQQALQTEQQKHQQVEQSFSTTSSKPPSETPAGRS